MADGTTKPLDEVEVGDRIYGTVRSGPYRRYVQTSVLAHWSVEKLAYRVTLEDGTRIVASGDHRFLTDRGWKFVTGSDQGAMRRPHLTTNNKLMGTGAFTASPVRTADYKRGYLCGLIRGDGLLKFYQYEREGRVHGNQDQFRLVLTDGEGLERAQRYLLDFAVSTDRFLFQEASGRVRRLEGIRTQARRRVEDIQKIIKWRAEPSVEWSKGFLAGIFDAEGGYNSGVLRITNTDAVIINQTTRSLEQLKFSFVIESPSGNGVKPIKVVRLRGGLREQLRFFHSVDPAIARKQAIEGTAIKNNCRLRVVAIERLGTRRLFDITTGTGNFIANGVVSHNCYARRTHWFLDEDGVDEWSSKIFVKINAPEVLRQELARPGWKREEVALGTATDPYQAIEGKYRITRGILEALRDFRTPVSIVTRSPMIVRDRQLLAELAARAGVTVCISIATTDPTLARSIEPTVAPPAQRLKTVERLSSMGIRTGVLLAPILPGLTDGSESLAAVIESARGAGASFVGHRILYLGEVTRDAFMRFLKQSYPDLVRRYQRLYPGKYAPAVYEKRITGIVDEQKARLGPLEPRYLRPPREAEQLELL